MTSGAVLIIDDELRSQESLKRVLAEEFDVLLASNAQEAEAILAGDLVQAILCDQRMPGVSGVDFLRHVRETWPDPVRMIISGFSESEDIIAGVNEAGIYQYITKPWRPEKLLETVRDAVRLYHLQKEPGGVGAESKPSHGTLNRVLAERRREQKKMFEFDRIVHDPNGPMVDTLALARKATGYDISVLVTGASGAGKELLARAIHFGSARGDKPFVIENCGALPDELLESELFGCKKGAYTGAYQDRIGLFELADGGTIFLDEIGETSPAFQVKLLRVLQEREIRPLGAARSRKIDVRVISATNRDLENEVEQGRFRRDLFYRLNAFPIHLPALSERRGDIPRIAESILAEVNRSFRRKIPGFAPETMRRLCAYVWPGNVRELHNEIQRMVVMAEAEEPLGAHLLSARVGAERGAAKNFNGPSTLKDQVEALERVAIAKTLLDCAGNISHAAEKLGLSRVGLRAKIDRYDLRRDVGGGYEQ
ncbi:sigma-54-dependent Fis family transcriptional regulator [Rhodoblastus sphagnicola]|uniref:Sigma-54-dependent Fis family transcriptional regulator n=1 Tax=Rhodoblastus sphagnicola TaxID=333368 RepID=A0A2S6N598_9HYPH|nr:sigma-54 dependent transcriptional regulator [Rhodoblastus sphagnicola]MBB4197157.1 two-component system response regulator HupR/HoxA [Rhodoblastus sphagnicola]PPQ29772.1 sigma-54-dependent Fis family transcriptional regulator [Rhodoblastus sphagnicola]